VCVCCGGLSLLMSLKTEDMNQFVVSFVRREKFSSKVNETFDIR